MEREQWRSLFVLTKVLEVMELFYEPNVEPRRMGVVSKKGG